MKQERRYDSDLIRSEFDRILGQEASGLVFKTLKLVYKIDEETIASNCELFEQKIRKMLGPSTADIIMSKIANG